MAINFWKDYISQKKNDLRELPFFHSTCAEENKELFTEDYLNLRSSTKDSYYDDKKVFFFYGRPVYKSEKWCTPVILGINFFELQKKINITPEDSGMIFSLKNDEKFELISEKTSIKDFSIQIEFCELIPTINNYLKIWFDDLQEYINGNPKKDYMPNSPLLKYIHNKVINYKSEELNDIFSEDFIKKHSLNLDARRKTVELAVSDMVSLTNVSKLCFLGILRDCEHIEKIKNLFRVEDSDFETIKYEYEFLNEKGLPKGIDGWIDECEKAYKTKININ